MDVILLGSMAVHYYEFDYRKPIDMDCVIHFDDLEEFQELYKLKSLVPRRVNKFHGIDPDGKHYEIEVAGLLEESSSDLLYGIRDNFHRGNGNTFIPPLNLLLQIKLCHQFKFSKHFEKTRNDILFLRKVTTKFIDALWEDFLLARSKEAMKKTPRLKGVSKEEFFVDKYGDVKQIVHDTIHLCQALDGLPAYTRFQKGEVECCMKTFFEVDEQVRLNAVFEESATLAVERAIWPSQYKCDEYKAFRGSLQRLCCHITSGRFREYAWENYDKVLAMYKNGDILKRLETGFKNGTVKFQKEGETV